MEYENNTFNEPSYTDGESVDSTPQADTSETYIETFIEKYEDAEAEAEEENEPLIVYEVNTEYNDSVISSLQLLNQSNDLILENTSGISDYFLTYEANQQIIYDELKQLEKINHSLLMGAVVNGFILACILGTLVAQYIISQFK